MIANPAQRPLHFGTAGFGVRTVAYLVDALLLSLVGGAFPFLLIGGSPQPNGAAAGTSGLVALIYFAVFWSHLGGGRTLGMRLLRLRVVRTDMSPLSPGRAVIRFLGLWISFLVCFVGVLWVAFDSRHQGWHDKIADSVVIRN